MRSLTSFFAAAAVLFLSPSWASASDHCPADLDGDGQVRVPDLIMLLAAWGPCQLCGNGVVDPGEECDPPDGVTCDDNCQIIPQDCCFPHPPPVAGCDDPICESTVCAVDPSCCDTVWDEECAVAAADDLCPECDGLDCCFEHSTAGCTNPDCEAFICFFDISCCSSSWHQDCVELAAGLCEQCFFP